MSSAPGQTREELLAKWVEWVTDNLGRDPGRARAAAEAATDQTLNGAGFSAAASAAREAWAGTGSRPGRSMGLETTARFASSAGRHRDRLSPAIGSGLGCAGIIATGFGALAATFFTVEDLPGAGPVLLLSIIAAAIGILILWVWTAAGAAVMIASADLAVAEVAVVTFRDHQSFFGATSIVGGATFIAASGAAAGLLHIWRMTSVSATDGRHTPPEARPRLRHRVRSIRIEDLVAVIGPLLLLAGAWVFVINADAHTITLAVSPDSAKPGDTVVITATNLPPNQSGYIEIGTCAGDVEGIGYQSESFAFTADSQGTARVVVTITQTQAPGDRVPVDIGWGGVNYASTTFEITNPTWAGCH